MVRFGAKKVDLFHLFYFQALPFPIQFPAIIFFRILTIFDHLSKIHALCLIYMDAAKEACIFVSP